MIFDLRERERERDRDRDRERERERGEKEVLHTVFKWTLKYWFGTQCGQFRSHRLLVNAAEKGVESTCCRSSLRATHGFVFGPVFVRHQGRKKG